MNRTSLFTIAALFLTTVPAFPAETLPPNDAAWSRAVNLMPLIDTKKDAVSGQWQMENGALTSGNRGSKALPSALLEIPYQPPAEYDFRIVFSRRTGNRNVVQVLAKAGRSFAWDMAGAGNTMFGFTLINRQHLPDRGNPTTLKREGLTNNQKYVSIVQVRNDGLKAYLDGKLICEWRTSYKDMSPFSHYRLPDPSLLGLASFQSSVIFHQIELLEITGKGKVVSHSTVAQMTSDVENTKAPAKPADGVAKETTPANDPAWSRAVNLMPLIDPGRDVIKGTWKSTGGTLVSGAEQHERIQIPYEPPDEYDFRIVFVRTEGDGGIVQYISRVGHAALWMMGGSHNKLFGFETVGGKDVAHNASTVRSRACLKNGRVSTSLLQVRRNGVKAYLDGKLITQLQTDFRDVGLSASWEMPNHGVLGLGSWESATEFQKIELLEITGKGRAVRRPTVATTTRAVEPPKPKTPAKPPAGAPPKTTPSESPKPASATWKADPEQQKSARPFQKNQSTIKALFVLQMPNGQRLGGAQDIIATVELSKPDYETTFVFATTVASDTRISCDEAMHLVKVRYPIWKAGHQIRFSYGNKYTKQAGGSAGGAFSVLFMSLLEGFTIDPHFAMTGDVTVDGKIREVGAVAEKLRGAMLDKCKVVAIPAVNKDSLNDLVILYPLSMLWNAQVLSISTLEEATAAARQDRPPNLARALTLFAQVQTQLGTNGTVLSLRDQGVTQKLQEVLKLAPNHLSAEFMLRAGSLQMPSTLSLQSSMEEIWSAAGLMLYYLYPNMEPAAKGGHRYRMEVPQEAATIALNRLNWLDTRLDPKTRNLKAAMVDFINELQPLWRQSGFPPSAYRQLQAKRDKVWGEIIKLDVDRKILEEMMHR